MDLSLSRSSSVGSSLHELALDAPRDAALEAGRFTILSADEREEGLAQAQENISPSGISGFFRSMGNAFLGLFSSKQAQLNAARALIEKPTAELTASINFITRFNGLLGERSDQFAPMTFENFDQYIEALQNNQLLVEDGESETGFTAVDPTRVAHNEVAGLSIEILQMRIDRDLERLGPQLIDVKNSLTQFQALTPNQVLSAAQKTVNAWRKAIHTVGATVSDAEFRGLVTKASQNLGATVTNPEFVEAQAVSDWAQDGQQNFVNEAAQTFAEAVKSIKEQAGPEEADQNMEALTTLLGSIDTRARNIGAILGREDTDEIKDSLLEMLNDVPAFKAALTTAQDELREVVRTNQSVEDLTATRMDGVLAGQTGIIEAEKTLANSTLKGEAAIAGTFGALLQPDVVLGALMTTGMSEADARQKVAEEFPGHADRAVETFASTDRELAGVLYQNDAIIAEGQTRAEVALGKLDLLNQFVSEENEAEMTVDVDIENDPIELPESQEERQAFVGEELREAFLERFEALAGMTDEEAHPTLLAQLIGHLGPDGTEAVLGRVVRVEAIVAAKTTEAGQALAHNGRALVTFKASEDEAPRGIDALRQLISANRDVIDHKKQQQIELERAMTQPIDAERVSEDAPGIGTRIANWFRSFGSSTPASKPSVDRLEDEQLDWEVMGSSSPSLSRRSLSVGSDQMMPLFDSRESGLFGSQARPSTPVHTGSLLDLDGYSSGEDL
ncbi:MAG: hypothetical protein KFB93_05560 [Simkaniaceae bacterium]|nr:MAG: hypothetical protein KFB93_05560 [Simkaniaceae bacterium]